MKGTDENLSINAGKWCVGLEEIAILIENYLMHQGWDVRDAVDEASRLARVFLLTEIAQVKMVSFRPSGQVYRIKITGVE